MPRQKTALSAGSAGPPPTPARLMRGVTATWWYTVTGILFIELVLLGVWLLALLADGRAPLVLLSIAGSGLAWCGATVFLLHAYRSLAESTAAERRRGTVVPLLVMAAAGVIGGVAVGSWLLGALPAVQALVLLRWPPGVRPKLVVAGMAVLAVAWFIDSRVVPTGQGPNLWFVGVYTLGLPAISVVSLWWWDVLAALDRARASEARLGATQERLRLATDVHDLQGHHLQVIALQLELVERLRESDPAAAAEHLRAARGSVDAARQGTRDLATRFRSVPLRDELANAVDLLRAAGTAAEAVVDPAADLAPADVLGPVIRETTTNVLRHGGGEWARLSLERAGESWHYEIENDAGAIDAAAADADEDAGAAAGRTGGSGLEGIRRRVEEAGGRLEFRREKHGFLVRVTVPGGGGA